MIRSHTDGRVRIVTLDRPDALNAFNEALYDATTEELLAAAADPAVAVLVITGEGRSFSAGTDLLEMAQRGNPDFTAGVHGFPGMVDALIDFPKPLLCAVNGLALGIGATMLALADLVFMSTEARIKCPFTSLGVAPEAASSYTFPQLLGRQNAMWTLLSSEWLGAEECQRMGLAFQACAPEELMAVTLHHAQILAAKPISSLVESKRIVVEPIREQIRAARTREDAGFAKLLGGPANREALMAFAERREPDFANVGD